MDNKETVAQRLDRAADRFEAAGDPRGTADAREAAAMCRQCETLEEAESMEEAFWSTHREPRSRSRQDKDDAFDSDSDGGASVDLEFLESVSPNDDDDDDDDGGVTGDADIRDSDNS